MRWLLAFMLMLPALGLAQSIDISHNEISAASLPAPGQPLVITAHVKGLVDKSAVAKVLVVRDGLLLELNDSEGESTADKTSFSVTVPSPLAELSYQFIVSSSQGFIGNSKRFSVKRPCVPDVLITNVPPTKQQDVATLTAQVNGLQKDIDLYEETLNLIGNLEKEFGNK